MNNRITELFDIKYPLVQGGMIWCSGWELASTVSNAGGLGLIGSGSMNPDILREHIQKCKKATDKPFGVNVPLIFSHAEDFMHIILEEKVPIVFTSAGNPKKYTKHLKDNGIKVAHVVANKKSALKCEEAGVDAIVAEGFEAGGHNGREETTTLALIPMIADAVDIPVIAAGGIACGKAMFACMALGAEGVQIGSRFVVTEESSAHPNFKKKIIEAGDGDTLLTMKSLVAVRLLKNKFFDDVMAKERAGATAEEMLELLGKGRSKAGMFDGDLDEGELEIGQVSAIINKQLPAADVVDEIISDFLKTKQKMCNVII